MGLFSGLSVADFAKKISDEEISVQIVQENNLMFTAAIRYVRKKQAAVIQRGKGRDALKISNKSRYCFRVLIISLCELIISNKIIIRIYLCFEKYSIVK
ncbi:hypothetical protein ACMGEE_12285 [Erwinia sp. DT-104]|uniref:hypothetical protein n=1 Tax=Erwinia sp. DT-104 TaxID=3396161 RepID=UPI003F1AC7BF